MNKITIIRNGKLATLSTAEKEEDWCLYCHNVIPKDGDCYKVSCIGDTNLACIGNVHTECIEAFINGQGSVQRDGSIGEWEWGTGTDKEPEGGYYFFEGERNQEFGIRQFFGPFTSVRFAALWNMLHRDSSKKEALDGVTQVPSSDKGYAFQRPTGGQGYEAIYYLTPIVAHYPAYTFGQWKSFILEDRTKWLDDLPDELPKVKP